MDSMNDATDASRSRFTLSELQPWNDPERVTENERLLGGLCYASQVLIPIVLPVIVLMTGEANKSRFLRYHAAHSLALLVVSILYGLVALFGFLLAMLVKVCLACLAWVLFVPPVVVLAYYSWQAFVGRAPVIPWITEILHKYDLM